LSTFTTVTANQSPLTGSSLVTATRSISGLIYNGVYYFRTVVTTAGVQVKSAIGSQQLYAVPTWTDTTLARPRRNVVYSDGVSASGLPAPTYSIISGSLPAGLTLNSTTGAITGTPTDINSYSWTIRASNSAGSQTASYSYLVSTGIEGGTESNVVLGSSTYRLHFFSSTGTITNSSGANKSSVEVYLGGGGGSGGNSVGGGGGSGGLSAVFDTFFNGNSITFTIGAGGASQTAGAGGQGFNGNDSSATWNGFYMFGGGGGGGGFYNANTPTKGSNGNPGSNQGYGGGGSGGVGTSSAGGTPSGGSGYPFSNNCYISGGGGSVGGLGGNGSSSCQSGSGGGGFPVYTGFIRFGGGGGGGELPGTGGGVGGNGSSGNTPGVSAAAGTAAGGGGSRNQTGNTPSGAGGSGFAAVLYIA
jgi:hypothetical protein